MRAAAIVLARMGSTRLPGKALRPLCGEPVLARVIERLQRVGLDAGVIVATTTLPQDDQIEALCARTGAFCFRGSETDILDRCIECCRAFGLDLTVRVGGDSPLIDPGVVKEMLERFLLLRQGAQPPDYLSNTLRRTYPLGLDAEIIPAGTYLRIREAIEHLPPEEKRLNQENVVPYLHGHPEQFRLVSHENGPGGTELRWTLDTPEDFDLISRIYDTLCPTSPDFGMEQVFALLERHPGWSAINSAVKPVTGFWSQHERQAFRERFGDGGEDNR